MTYNLWQVREKDGSKVWLYAIRHDCDVTDFIDTETQTLYNNKGDWKIQGYKDYPKFFRWNYTGNKENKNY
jgi:hypothetical protein